MDNENNLKCNSKELALDSFELTWKFLEALVAELIKSIPLAGPIISAGQAIYNKNEMYNVKKGMETLSSKLTEYEKNNKISKDFDEREMYFLIKRYVTAIYNQPDEEIIRCLSNFVANCISEEFSDDKLKIIILDKISKYTRQHIYVLKGIVENDESKLQEENIGTNVNQLEYQKSQIAYHDNDNIEFCINELEKDGFIKREIGAWGSDTYTPYSPTGVGIRCLKMIEYL